MKAKQHLKLFVFIFLIFTFIFSSSSSVFAKGLPRGRETEWAEQGYTFYDPSGNISENKSTCSAFGGGGGGNCNFAGNTKDERLWSGLRSYGFTPEQTAALMGNFAHEGGSPTRQEDSYNNARDKDCRTQEGNPYTVWTGPTEHHGSCIGKPYSAGKPVQGIGLGFAQWTSQGRREHYLNVMKNLGLYDAYFDGDAYKEWGRLSDDALRSKVDGDTYASLWCAALNFVYEEIFNGDYKAFLNKDSVDSMADYVATTYEGCSGCSSGSSENLARRQSAKEYYQKYLDGGFNSVDPGDSGNSSSSSSSSSSGTSSGSEDGSQILIIGDSITVRSTDELKALMPNVTIDAEVSRGFPKGVEILESKGSVPDIIVFALGTNTENVRKDDAERVLQKAGDSKVIFVTNYSLGQHDYTGNNALFNSLKTDHRNVVVADWSGAVSSDPTKYIANEGGSMDVHPTIPEGTKLFAKTIYQAITNKTSNCGGGSGASSASGVSTSEINGSEYAFPIAGATKANLLNGKNGLASALSPVPCSSYSGCHHDYSAVDTGIKLEPSRASEYGGSADNMMYYSTGAQVVAITSGTVEKNTSGYNGDPKCGSIVFAGDDGRKYWIGHTLYDPNIKVGDHFEVGQNMTIIGPPVCANNTQAHVHIHTFTGTCTKTVHTGCTNDAIDIINKTYESLPEN